MDDPVRNARHLILLAMGSRYSVFRELSGARRLVDFVAALSLFCLGTTMLAMDATLGTLVGVILNAIALNMCVLLLHEGMHGTLMHNKHLNRALSTILGVIVGVSFTAYRALHDLHHDFVGRNGDPDFYPGYARSKYMLWFMYHIRILGGAIVYIFLIPGLAWKKAERKTKHAIVFEYLLLVGVWGICLFAFPVKEFLMATLVPLVVVSYFSAVRGFAEHSFVDDSDPLTGSRTITGDPVTNFLMLNINYHLAHHLFPEVPSYRLKQLHQAIEPFCKRQTISSSYLKFISQFFLASLTLNEKPIGTVEQKN